MLVGQLARLTGLDGKSGKKLTCARAFPSLSQIVDFAQETDYLQVGLDSCKRRFHGHRACLYERRRENLRVRKMEQKRIVTPLKKASGQSEESAEFEMTTGTRSVKRKRQI